MRDFALPPSSTERSQLTKGERIMHQVTEHCRTGNQEICFTKYEDSIDLGFGYPPSPVGSQ